MTQLEQAEHLADLGVTFGGFIFYPKSPRYVFKNITTNQIRKLNSINKVGVFVNASIEEVLHMVDECRLHMVQLHGDETPKYCEKIADYVSVSRAGIMPSSLAVSNDASSASSSVALRKIPLPD